MLPNVDDSIEIIDVNNNEEDEPSKKSNGEPDSRNQSAQQAHESYQLNEEKNIKTVRILRCQNKVADKLFTLEVPLVCDELEIISVIFPDQQIVKDDTGYKIVDINTENKIEVNQKRDADGILKYVVNIQSETPRQDKFVPVEDDECQVVEKDEVSSPLRNPLTSSKRKGSVDSQETYYEAAENHSDEPIDEKFYSCIDAENDINVKENDKNVANLFTIPERDEYDDIKYLKEDDFGNKYPKVDDVDNKYPKEHEDQHILADTKNTRDTREIHPSRFYSQTSRKSSCNTVQLSDSPDQHSPVTTKKKSSRTSKSARNTILAVYPLTPAQGRITIYKDNYKCLGDGEFLNDVIIDFYLKYLMNEVLSEEDRNRTYVFSTQFFTRLSKPAVAHTEEERKMTGSERRYVGVQKWTKHVNIFEKDFVIVPINEHCHWNLAIICFPGLVGMIDEDAECLQRPCILFFDSLYNGLKERTASILRNYLKREYYTKMGESKQFSDSVLQSRTPLVPTQKNATDCGLYLLQYVEQFFTFPIMDFTVSSLDLSGWFKQVVVRRKRAEIASLIADLAKSYNSENPVPMPLLEFPSNNVSSDEGDLEIHTGKMENSFPRDTSPSFESIPPKIRKNEKSDCPSSSKNEEKVQSFLDDWVDEDDLEIHTGKRKISFPRDTSPSFESTPPKIRKNEKSNVKQHEKSNFPSPSKNEKKVQSFLADWVDVRNAQSSSDPFRLSSNFENVEDGMDHDRNGMDGQKKNDLSNTYNVSDDEAEKSVEFISECDTSNENSLLKPPKNKHSNVRKISLIKENFSSTKSHIFQKSSIFSTDSDSTVSIARPKRQRQPKSNEEVMKEFVAQFQARKKKKEKKIAEDSKKASWIDESVFKPTGSNVFSVYNADDDPGIPPSTSYKKFKMEKENFGVLNRWKL